MLVVVFEEARRHAVALMVRNASDEGRSNEAGGKRWEFTGERFTDPTTGKIVEVMYDPATGERRYVEPRDGSLHKSS